MEKEAQKYHLEVLNAHSQKLYNDLIYEHNITSESLKEIEFEEGKTGRGYFALKDKQKYFIEEKIVKEMPIKLGTDNMELIYKDDVVIKPINPTKFKIVPHHRMTTKSLITSIAPFTHTQPNHLTLFKIVGVAAYIGRTYICFSSKSHFGKSSFFDVLHALTDKCPVFKPRSVPGLLNKLNVTGNIVFDEAQGCRTDVREIMEEISQFVGGGKSVYINGAMKAKNTKVWYDTHLQSITYLYNNVDHYKNPGKDYFEFMFNNNKAIDNRFLKLKMEGELTQVFSRDFNIPLVAEENKMDYIAIAKELLYLQELKQTNNYEREFRASNFLGLKGRKKVIYDEVTWVLDQFCYDQKEFDDYVELLNTCISGYQDMVGGISDQTIIVDEEMVE